MGVILDGWLLGSLIMLQILATIVVLTSVNSQLVVRNLLSTFSEANCQSFPTVCATSSSNRFSVRVRSEAQCLHECQHGGDDSTCVGVNYWRSNNTCDVYNRCPASYAGNIAGCQYMQKESRSDARLPCAVSIGSQYQYVPATNCSFPFTYNGQIIYNCMPSLSENCGFKACLTSMRKYAFCYPPADYLAKTSTKILTVSSLTPVTVQSVFGWIVVHQRASAYNWQLPWSSYKNGFGDSASNFWLGLEYLYRLTSVASYQLRAEVRQSSTAMWFSAEYSSFSIGNEANSFYTLSVSGYSGDAGDSLQYTGDWYDGRYGAYLHNGMKFSTYDAGHDLLGGCAGGRGGGWWFNACYMCCTTCDDAHAGWYTLPNDYAIDAARMMIKMTV